MMWFSVHEYITTPYQTLITTKLFWFIFARENLVSLATKAPMFVQPLKYLVCSSGTISRVKFSSSNAASGGVRRQGFRGHTYHFPVYCSPVCLFFTAGPRTNSNCALCIGLFSQVCHSVLLTVSESRRFCHPQHFDSYIVIEEA
jgi:hypothetical protein